MTPIIFKREGEAVSSIGNPLRSLDTGGGDGMDTSEGLLVWQFRLPIYHFRRF